MPTFSANLEATLHRALAEANERGHEFATLEHLLFGLLDDQDAVAVLKACNVKIDVLRQQIAAYLDNELSNLVTHDRSMEASPTAGFQRVIQRSILHVQSSGREEVTGANVLVALFSERESHAVYFLQQQDMTRLDAVSYISHGIAKTPGASEPRRVTGASSSSHASERPEKEGGALATYCINLNQKARQGKIDPL
ncbi:MAG TPA: Clp protease N-terminal domain-containing protein, partial [Sphingomonadales bacterium]